LVCSVSDRVESEVDFDLVPEVFTEGSLAVATVSLMSKGASKQSYSWAER